MTVQRRRLHEGSPDNLAEGKLGYYSVGSSYGLYFNDNGDIKKLMPVPINMKETERLGDPVSLDAGQDWKYDRVDGNTFYVRISSNADITNKISFPLGKNSALTLWKGSESGVNTSRRYSLFLENKTSTAYCHLRVLGTIDGGRSYKFCTRSSLTAYTNISTSNSGFLYNRKINIPKDINSDTVGGAGNSDTIPADENLNINFIAATTSNIKNIVASNILEIWDIKITSCFVYDSVPEEIRFIIQCKRLDKLGDNA
jgi:hypothetical protein